MNRKVLLIEPNYKNKYPPMGLMKIATYYRMCGDDVRFFKGDLKMLAASSAFIGVRQMPLYLMAVSLSGIFVLVGLILANSFARARMRHLLRCVFDWRYDRKAGAAALPPKDDERMRVPFGIAIAIGTWLTLSMEAYSLMGR